MSKQKTVTVKNPGETMVNFGVVDGALQYVPAGEQREILLTDAVEHSIAEEQLVLVKGSTSSDDEKEMAPARIERGADYNSHTVDELKQELEQRGLKVSGTKDELIDRLQTDDHE